MTEKQPMKDVLNIRVDEALGAEVERIAELQGTSASEAARHLIRRGVEVERQVEASKLRLPYEWDISKMPGRVVIEAKWQPYTRRQIAEMEYPPDDDEVIDVERRA
jgi:hypothetical protein